MGSCVVTSDKCPISGPGHHGQDHGHCFHPTFSISLCKINRVRYTSTEYKSYNENLHYNENPTNYPAAKILNLLQSFSFIPGLFSSKISNSSNETLDESGNNSTDYQYHNNVFNDSDFEYDSF